MNQSNHLVSSGRFVTCMTTSVVRLNAEPFGLIALPIKLPMANFPLAVITVKNRTLAPAVEVHSIIGAILKRRCCIFVVFSRIAVALTLSPAV
jgi:hypothetical protein